MRPLELKMTAFGPYAGTQIINFERFGEKGLYLITGATGSGKTSVLDALKFALYGVLSGSVREAGMMRSKYASEETHTEVSLTFLCRGRKYSVKRSPSYERRKKKGKGVVKTSAYAELLLPDGSCISRTDEVNSKIFEILGVSERQFSQIAMIAQGDFQRLILADTDSRTNIFRSIFKTDSYERFAQILSERAKSAGSGMKKLGEELSRTMEGIRFSADTIFLKEAESVKAKKKSAGEAAEIFIKLIEEDHLKLESVKNLKKNNAAALERIIAERTRARSKKDAEDKIAALSKQVKDCRLSLQCAQERLEAARAEYAGIDELRSRAAAAADDVKKHAEAAEILEEKLSSEKQLKLQTDDKKNKTGLCSELEARLDSFKQAFRSLENAEACKEKHLRERDAAAVRLKAAEDFKRSADELSECEKRRLKILADSLRASEAERKKSCVYQDAKQKFLASQAGLLAETLQEGCPCPVCGSPVHPHKAGKSENFVTKEMFEAAEKEFQEAQTFTSRLMSEAKNLGLVNERLKAAVQEKMRSAFGSDDLDNSEVLYDAERKRINSLIDDFTKKAQEEEAKIVSRRRLEKEIKDCEGQLKVLKPKISAAEAEIKCLEYAVSDLQNRLEAKRAEIKTAERGEAKAEAERLTAEVRRIQKEKDEAEGSFNELKLKEEKLAGQINLLEESVRSSVCRALNIIDGEYETLSADKNTLEIQEKELTLRISANEKSSEDLSRYNEGFGRAEREKKLLDALSKTASGNLEGREKIAFETYVQIMYFEKIIRRANSFLRRISDGKYDLVRAEKAENNRSKSGLDLEVVDHFNGTRRSVKTLSGGEQFMASLSLALGFSEEISCSAGGVRLDSMFIDEGFGTLDEDTLDKASKALNCLAQNNKLIGIISHVAEMRSSIEKQIVVIKTKSGSRAEVRA